MKHVAVRPGVSGEKAWRFAVAVLAVMCVSVLVAAPARAGYAYDPDVLVKVPPLPSEPQPSSPAGSAGSSDGSLFDAWWAKLFCLWLLIPVAAFVRRLFTGWLNLLGVDEEKYAGLAAAGAGGLIGLGMAVGGLASALSGATGWGIAGMVNRASRGTSAGLVTTAGVGGPAAPGGPGGPGGSPGGGGGGGGTAAHSPSSGAGSQPGGGGGGGAGTGAVDAQPAQASGGGGALPPEGVRGEGLPEAGDVHEARRQAVNRMREMIGADRGRAEGARARHAYLSSGVGILGDMAQAAGAVTGAIFGIGLGGGKAAELASRAFGAAAAAPFRAFEAYMRTPPPMHRSSLDGARYRVA
ncbi:MAG: hypothetical protein AB1609_14010 [Bacillota bacterium]